MAQRAEPSRVVGVVPWGCSHSQLREDRGWGCRRGKGHQVSEVEEGSGSGEEEEERRGEEEVVDNQRMDRMVVDVPVPLVEECVHVCGVCTCTNMCQSKRRRYTSENHMYNTPPFTPSLPPYPSSTYGW